jgi:3-methyladenine DNA glycosylase AlkD
MNLTQSLHREILSLRNPEKAVIYKNFHKIGNNGYAKDDEFFGLTVPQCRNLAQKYASLSLSEIDKILDSKIHEERYVAVLILAEQYERADQKQKKKIVDFYLKHAKRVNGWDFVDSTAPQILGEWLVNKDTKILSKLAKSSNLWERRIAIVATYAFIKRGEFQDTLRISEILLKDKHDLIHKAVGWMLREVGKRDEHVLEEFLKKHYQKMPRTMLRYSIERFTETKRKRYLEGKI